MMLSVLEFNIKCSRKAFPICSITTSGIFDSSLDKVSAVRA